jgi:hypothetical protein
VLNGARFEPTISQVLGSFFFFFVIKYDALYVKDYFSISHTSFFLEIMCRLFLQMASQQRRSRRRKRDVCHITMGFSPSLASCNSGALRVAIGLLLVEFTAHFAAAFLRITFGRDGHHSVVRQCCEGPCFACWIRPINKFQRPMIERARFARFPQRRI